MSDWQALEVKIPGVDLLEQARNALESMVVFLEVVKTLLETISLFLIDFSNPVRAILQTLLALVSQLFESLRQTGMYGYFDFPNPVEDPNFDRSVGGYQAYVQRFKSSLVDSRDPFKPQPLAGSTLSGFVMIVADVETPYALMRLVKILMGFFGKELLSPKYTAPANVKVIPVGSKDDPILRVADLFGADIGGLALEWSLATNLIPPDPGFTDLLGSVSAEFIPQKWLIEKTSRAGGPELLSKEVLTNHSDRDGIPIKRQERVRDDSGDPFRKFEEYIVIDAKTATGTYLTGQLGKFRYIDKNVEKNKVYYYRVRAFSGSLAVSGTSLTLAEPIYNSAANDYTQQWPSSNPSDLAIMGRPSPVVNGTVPVIPKDLDIILALENTLKMAFSLGFHLPLPGGATFDSSGRNTGNTPASDIGTGSLASIAGPLSLIDATYGEPKGVTFTDKGTVAKAEADKVTKEYPNVVHNYFVVEHYAAKLAMATAMALYENGEALTSFRNLFKSPTPFPVPPSTKGQGYFDSNTDTLEGLVTQFNILPSDFPKVYAPKVYETNYFAYNNANVRLNLLSVTSFLRSFTFGGTKPDWVSISLLQDVVPWTGKFLYDLMSRVEALLDAYRSAMDELKSFINLIVTKIDTLERFIQFLIEILNFLESISAGFYFLSLPSTDKGLPGWYEAIDTAGGTPPPSGPGGYTAGVTLAYVGTNIDAFANAFSLIF
jgi:hypothetical protein